MKISFSLTKLMVLSSFFVGSLCSCLHGESNLHVPYRLGVNGPGQGVFEGQTSRPMRYFPTEDKGFQINNGDTNGSVTFYVELQVSSGDNFNIHIRSNNRGIGPGNFTPTLELSTQ